MIKNFIVRGLTYQVDEYGNIFGQNNNLLKSRLDRFGYPTVTLGKKNCRISKRIHRIVAENFIPTIDKKPEVNHIDGNKQNNYYKNLEWVNRQEQISHMFRIGLGRNNSGEKNNKAILKESDVKTIRNLYAQGSISIYRIAKIYNIGWQTANHVVKRTTWKNV